MDPDPGGPKTRGSGGFGSGSATLPYTLNLLQDVQCRIPIRHFFSRSRRLLTKIFKSAETVNEKFDVYEVGDKGQ